MKQRYLEVTYRSGKAVAAYLYLSRKDGDTCVRTERHEQGLLIDFAADDRPIGFEITAPTKLKLDVLNKVLIAVNQDPVSAVDLAPLAAT